jgi:GT2 family glycosyltransferase
VLGNRTFQAVTAAVCLCRRTLWEQLGGLSDSFPINYGDVDFCLRARDLGARTVLAARSRWIHYESVSRGVEIPPELPMFAATWRERLGGTYSVDPYCSPWRHLLAQPPENDRRPT